MNKGVLTVTTAFFLMLPLTMVAKANITEVPEPFQASDESSTFRIKYDDVSILLRHAVVNTGPSSRTSVSSSKGKTGTRLKQTTNRSTVHEGNRFYFEMFQRNDKATASLQNLKKGLEVVPSQVTLSAFSRDEQLAYWLNLYNITMIDEISKIYPQHKLKQFLIGEDSVLDKKTLNVAGVSLSLNDIEFILWKNYNGDPLIVYGMYQGIVGGPNIRRAAFTGKNVYRSLKKNAKEFANSNRGSRAQNANTFRVSSLYKRYDMFFESDEALKRHLLDYLDSSQSKRLRSASQIKRNIDDWTITDLYGSYRSMAGSLADSRVGLMGSGIEGISPGLLRASVYETPGNGRYSHDLLARLGQINDRRLNTSRSNATVTVEELGTVEVEPENPE